MDIDKVIDGLGKTIEEKIKPLVQALWDCGYQTKSSCEGHTERGRGYPFVDILDKQNLISLSTQIQSYNQDEEIHWGLTYAYKVRTCRVYELRPLVTEMKDFLLSRKGRIDLIAFPQLYFRKYLLRKPYMVPARCDDKTLVAAQSSILKISAFLRNNK